MQQKRAKTSTGSNRNGSGLWLAPRHSLKSSARPSAGEEDPRTAPPDHSRLLELADTAMALWASAPKKSKRKAA